MPTEKISTVPSLKSMAKKTLFITFLFAITGLFCACGGSSNGDSDPGTDPGSSSTFAPDTSSPPNNSVYLTLAAQNGNTIQLAVAAKALQNIYGVWFNLEYDATLFEYKGAVEGDFLKQSGNTFFFASPDTNSIVVGITRQADASGVSGSGILCLLTFTGIDQGVSRFNFSSNHAADPGGNRIPGIQWFGGTGTVVM